MKRGVHGRVGALTEPRARGRRPQPAPLGRHRRLDRPLDLPGPPRCLEGRVGRGGDRRLGPDPRGARNQGTASLLVVPPREQGLPAHGDAVRVAPDPPGVQLGARGDRGQARRGVPGTRGSDTRETRWARKGAPGNKPVLAVPSIPKRPDVTVGRQVRRTEPLQVLEGHLDTLSKKQKKKEQRQISTSQNKTKQRNEHKNQNRMGR